MLAYFCCLLYISRWNFKYWPPCISKSMFIFSHLPNTIMKLLCKLSNNKCHCVYPCLPFHIYLKQLWSYHANYQITNGIMWIGTIHFQREKWGRSTSVVKNAIISLYYLFIAIFFPKLILLRVILGIFSKKIAFPNLSPRVGATRFYKGC